MPSVVVEMIECLAAVSMNSGMHVTLLKIDGETITSTLKPSRGLLERGKFYEATFREIEGPAPCHSEPSS